MLSSFQTRFRNFIWFLIFTFTLYCMPHLELLFPYRLHLFLAEAQAKDAESDPPPEKQDQPPPEDWEEKPPEGRSTATTTTQTQE
jgi:hypothetical protein